MSSPEVARQIGVAIVTFQPDEGLESLVRSAAAETPACLIVDNSVDPHARERVAVTARTFGVDLIANPSNLGIAAAINQAIRWAVLHRQQWLLLLDQDTRMVEAASLLAPFRQALCQLADCPGLAIVAGVSKRDTAGACQPRETKLAITSGSLLNVGLVGAHGGAWEALFIDGVDAEMCLRLGRRGQKIFAFDHSGIDHKVGSGRMVRVFGRALFLTEHSPVRRYYSARNRLLIARKHSQPVPWYHCLREDLIAPVFEANTLAKWRGTLLGLVHGLRGLSGPAPTSLSDWGGKRE
jgi:rhamnosyltransferase